MTAEAVVPNVRRRTVLDESAGVVARSYAEALVDAAAKSGREDEILDELESIAATTFDAKPEFAAIFESPTISPAVKDRVLAETFDGRVESMNLDFLRVLNRHARIDLLPLVVRSARAIVDKRRNRIHVKVKSAVPLDDDARSALVARLGELSRGTPVLHEEVDPALIAGLVVQIGDVVYDSSARNRLEQIRDHLIEGKLHEISSRRNQFCDSE
jgi:F-type H+-transporting ATPase subunit delta